jgi:hypothetical protein
MTKRNKLIVGAVVVLGAYYLYDRNKKMKMVSDLKAGANVSTDTPVLPVGGGSVPLQPVEVKSELRADNIEVAQGGNKFSNFAGKRGNSYFETIF